MRGLAICAGAGLLAGCATIVEGQTQAIRVEVHPPNGTCVLVRDGQEIASSVPGNRIVRINKAYADITVSCSAPGYAPASEKLPSSLSPYTVASFLLVDFGIVDALSGASHKYPERITVLLEPVRASR